MGKGRKRGLLGSPRVDKALDDRGQFLFPSMDDPGNAARINPYVTATPQKYVALRFKADKKTSNELKELTGAVTAQVHGETVDLLSIDDVMNAAGKNHAQAARPGPNGRRASPS